MRVAIVLLISSQVLPLTDIFRVGHGRVYIHRKSCQATVIPYYDAYLVKLVTVSGVIRH